MLAVIRIEGIELSVEYTLHKAIKGQRDSLGGIPGAGAQLDPDEPAWIEIEGVTCSANILDLLSMKMCDRLIRSVAETYSEPVDAEI